MTEPPLVPTVIQPSVQPRVKALNKRSSDTFEVGKHDAEVLSVSFSSTGRSVLTGSADRVIRIFSVEEESECLAILKGHKNAVTEVHWSAGNDRIFSSAADETCGAWDPHLCTRLQKLKGHVGIVNCCSSDASIPNLLVSGGDDGDVKVWDLRVRQAAASLAHPYPVLSIDVDASTYRVFSGCLDGHIRVFDIRKAVSSTTTSEDAMSDVGELMSLRGHTNSVTGIALSGNRSFLASVAADNTLRVWDARPFCQKQRDLAVCRGPTHNFEQTLHRVRWDPEDMAVATGDRHALIFSLDGVELGTSQPKLLYKLPGHTGAVTEVSFHPTEKIIASGATDKKVLIRKLN